MQPVKVKRKWTRRKKVAEQQPAELTPAKGIAGSLRALADYVEAEDELRQALISSVKELRLENIKLQSRGPSKKSSASAEAEACDCPKENGVVSKTNFDCPIHGKAD